MACQMNTKAVRSFFFITYGLLMLRYQDLLEDIRQHLLDEMQELPESPPSGYLPDLPIVSYYLTSIYDHSIYEALSKITQKLLPCQAAVERMMDLVCQVRVCPSLPDRKLLTMPMM